MKLFLFMVWFIPRDTQIIRMFEYPLSLAVSRLQWKSPQILVLCHFNLSAPRSERCTDTVAASHHLTPLVGFFLNRAEKNLSVSSHHIWVFSQPPLAGGQQLGPATRVLCLWKGKHIYFLPLSFGFTWTGFLLSVLNLGFDEQSQAACGWCDFHEPLASSPVLHLRENFPRLWFTRQQNKKFPPSWRRSRKPHPDSTCCLEGNARLSAALVWTASVSSVTNKSLSALALRFFPLSKSVS